MEHSHFWVETWDLAQRSKSTWIAIEFFKGTVGTGYPCCGGTHEGCLQCKICNVDTTSNIIVRRRIVPHGWMEGRAIQQASKLSPRGLSASQSRQRHPATKKNTDTCKWEKMTLSHSSIQREKSYSTEIIQFSLWRGPSRKEFASKRTRWRFGIVSRYSGRWHTSWKCNVFKIGPRLSEGSMFSVVGKLGTTGANQRDK